MTGKHDRRRDRAPSGDVPNRAVYERPRVVRQFVENSAIAPPEAAILRRYESDYVGGRVLDIGVGGGRTTPWLAPHCASYIGIDFSDEMIKSCRLRYPQWDFRWGDARDMSMIASASVDFALFSFNGIDYVDDDGRRQVLREVARVLKPGGLFVFSSHNLDGLENRTFIRDLLRLPMSFNPVRIAKSCARIGLRIFNCLRNPVREIRGANWAILNDPAHDFILRTYHVSPTAQRQQLSDAGFSSKVEMFDDDGRCITSTSKSPFVHYVARKTSAV